MGHVALDVIFERQTRIINEMVGRGGISTEGDVLRVKGFIEELEGYDGGKSLIEKVLMRKALKTLKDTVRIAEEEGIGKEAGVDV